MMKSTTSNKCVLEMQSYENDLQIQPYLKAKFRILGSKDSFHNNILIKSIFSNQGLNPEPFYLF